MGIFTFKNMISTIRLNGLTESFLPPMILNMSITASVIILFVLLARLALKKAPKIFSYALWAVVLFRLLCPVSITTDFSLLGLLDTPAVENTQHTTAVEYIPYDVVHTPNPEVQLPVPPVINNVVNEALPQEHAALGADPLEGEFAIGSLIWLLGIAAMVIYSAVSYILLRRKLVGAVLLRDNIYLADRIGSPFVMGFIRPKIYLPSALSAQEQGYIILHEQHHIHRGDHLIKALAFIALCIHWFNPLVWVAFVLSSKDMEMSCDEAVVKKLGESIRADYSASLLSLATGRRIIAGTPLAFGEGDTKSRIKNMLNWKKPTVWITVLATVACMVVIAVCGTNAANGSWVHLEEKSTETGAPRYTWNLEQPIQSWAIYEDVYSDGKLISSVARISDSFVDNGGASGRNDSFFLDVTPIFAANDDGFINELKVVYAGAGTIEWTLFLPRNHYSASAGHNHLSSEPFDSRNRFRLENNDEIILYSQLFSTAEDGAIYVDDLKNETVVRYRLVTSTEPAKAFNRQDHALELYELRIPILRSPEDARPLLKKLGIDEWGTYTLDRWSDANGTALLIAFENAPEDEDALMRQMHPVVYLLTALIGDIDGVHYSFPAGEAQQELITVYDTHNADRYAEAIGFKDLKTVACSPVGIRMLMEYLGWTGGGAEAETTGRYGTAEDVSYCLELAAGKTFQNMNLNRQISLLVEYEDLLDDYTLIARETEDGGTAYIVGQYNGEPAKSPLHGMYGIEVSRGEDEVFQFLYREEESETVDAVLASNKKEFPPSAGYRIEDSRIYWSVDSGLVLIQPKDNELLLDVPWNRYLHTPNGREYIEDAVSRGIALINTPAPYLYVYRISEKFGEIAERIPLTEAEADAILAENRQKILDGLGFSASLHLEEETIYYNEREGIPPTVLDLALKRCDYRWGDPSYIVDTLREARLDCDWLEEPLYADEADLPRLREILKNAEQGYVGSCGYGAKLTLTFTGGEMLKLFKGTDGCDTIVFGSYGGYFIGDKENIEFWEMFGLDPDTKERIETNPTGTEERTAVFSNGEITITVPVEYADLVRVDSLYSDNMFTTAANLYYAPAYFEDEGYAAPLNGGWLMSVSTTSYTSAASIAAQSESDWTAHRWTRDGKWVYVEHRPVTDYNCSAAQLAEYKAVMDSIQVHYDGLTVFDGGRAEAIVNTPFAAQALSGQSPLHGMFERTYETQLRLMQTDFERTAPLFLEKQTLEFDTCAVLLGETPANDSGELQGSAYILFRDGAMHRLPLPVDANGRTVCPAYVQQTDSNTLTYTVGTGNSACTYTINLSDRTVSMTVGTATNEAQTPTAPPSEELVRAALAGKNTEGALRTYGTGNLSSADFLTFAYTHLAQTWESETTYTFYSDVLHAAYALSDGKYDRVDVASVPTKLTFAYSDGAWKLSERWTPGSSSSVGVVFPAEAVEILERKGPGYYDPLPDLCDENAIRHYVTQTASVPSKTFTPADVEFTGQAINTAVDFMTYEERLAWADAGPDYSQFGYTSLGNCVENEGCLAYLGQWVGVPHSAQYGLSLRFADNTIAEHLPLPQDSLMSFVLPDTLEFRNGKLVYQVTFPSEEVTNEGRTLVHLAGTYHYEVDLTAKTLSLTVLQ